MISSRGTTTNSPLHFLDPSRRRHRWSHILTRYPGTSQLCRWSLDPQDLCLLQLDRWVTNRLGSATESICTCFDCRRTGEAKYPRLTRLGLDTSFSLLCCGRVSPGEYSRRFCHVSLIGQCRLGFSGIYPCDYCFNPHFFIGCIHPQNSVTDPLTPSRRLAPNSPSPSFPPTP